jgi:hypothetical protein
VAVGLAGSVAATILTAGAAGIALMGLYAGSVLAQARGASLLFMSTALLVLGFILHAKAQQPLHLWNSWTSDDDKEKEKEKEKETEKEEEHYHRLCRAFPTSPLGSHLKSFVQTHATSWLYPFNSADQRDNLKSQLVSFFNRDTITNLITPSPSSPSSSSSSSSSSHRPAADLDDHSALPRSSFSDSFR